MWQKLVDWFTNPAVHAIWNSVGAVLPFIMPGLQSFADQHPHSAIATVLVINAAVHAANLIPTNTTPRSKPA